MFWKVEYASAHVVSLVVEDVALREVGFSTGIDKEAAALGAKHRGSIGAMEESFGRFNLQALT